MGPPPSATVRTRSLFVYLRNLHQHGEEGRLSGKLSVHCGPGVDLAALGPYAQYLDLATELISGHHRTTEADRVRFPRISYEEMYRRKLEVMDRTAVTLCIENRLPIVVFDMGQPVNLVRVLRGDDVGTIVGAEDEAREERADGR